MMTKWHLYTEPIPRNTSQTILHAHNKIHELIHKQYHTPRASEYRRPTGIFSIPRTFIYVVKYLTDQTYVSKQLCFTFMNADSDDIK